jgi:hypothetical protein
MDRDALIAAYWQRYLLIFGSGELAVEAADFAAGAHLEWVQWATHSVAAGDHSWDLLVTEENVDATERAYEEFKDDPVAMLVALAEGAPSIDALAFLGASLIKEYLVYAEHAPDIDRIDQAARVSQKFRTALRCCWFDNHLPSETALRLRRFGDPL